MRLRSWLAGLLGICVFSLYSLPITAKTLSLSQQRELYDQAQDWLDKQNVKAYYRIKSQLNDYPLTPYLDYRAILINIGSKPPLVVRAFIDSHQDLPFSARISAPYVTELAQRKKWRLIADFLRSEPSGEQYQCWYYWSQYKTGKRSLAYQGAKKLWLSGHSVSSACDDLFSAWMSDHQLSDELVLQRMLLVFQERQSKLFNYLIKQLKGEENRRIGQAIKALYRSPERVIELAKQPLNPYVAQLIELSLEKLAASKPETAHALLVDMESDSLRLLQVKRALLRRWVNDDELSPEFIDWRKEQLLKLNDIDLLEMKIRHEIEQGNWQQVVFWIGQLPDEEKQSHRWRFWLARALSYQGDDDASQILLSQLLGERDFYGSAAAAILDKPIRYDVDVVDKQSKLLVRYQHSLHRIEELLARDKWTAARSEWHWLLREGDDEQRAALAYYAFDHGWSHFAILAAIKAQRWGALRVRFPIEYESTFKQLGKKLSIAPTTLMSIARQESALDKRARSYVGARGLMQLMPSTAKHTAKKFHLPLRSNQELYQPKTNINIASHYFRELLDRFDENRILAFAAYNAGPSRVNYWLKSSAGQQDVFQFIESIPYRETRGYVQNILMFETYYKQLLGESPELLTQSEATRSY